MARPSQQSEKSPSCVRWTTPTLSTLSKWLLEEIYMTHPSWWWNIASRLIPTLVCPCDRIRDASFSVKDLANLLDYVRVRYTLSEGPTRPFPWEMEMLMVVKCLFKQVLEGVEYLHKNDIIHRFDLLWTLLMYRDLKISNLLLNARGILKIGISSP